MPYQKKYIVIKEQAGGTRPFYVENQYRRTFETSIINNANTAVNSILAMRLRNFLKVTIPVYNQLQFDIIYSNDLGRNVYVSPLFCNNKWYFNIQYKSYIVVAGGIPVTNEITYIDIELIYKTSYCSNTILLSPTYNSSSDFIESYNRDRKERKLKKKVESLEDDLDDRDSEIDDKEEELAELKKQIEKLKKEKKSKKEKKEKKAKKGKKEKKSKK